MDVCVDVSGMYGCVRGVTVCPVLNLVVVVACVCVWIRMKNVKMMCKRRMV